nr:MAG TPA: putative nucleic-acid-binding protein [Bacteriophage sp.]
MKGYLDILIEQADGMMYCDFCRLLSILQWNV